VRPSRLLVVLTVAAGASASTLAASSTATDPQRASPLRVVPWPTPPLRVPHYRTRGTYPRLSGDGTDLRRVNAALRDAVLAEQRRYVPVALAQEARSPDPIRLGYKGLFRTSTVPRLISANTVGVSTLMPLDEVFPGGHEAGYWLSVTVLVPSGTGVRLPDLFTNRSVALRTVAVAARRALVRKSKCVRDSLARDPRLEQGFAPAVKNYRHFALTTRGLTIGFPIGQVALGICNRVEVTLRYATLGSGLSPLGKNLLAAIQESNRRG
jgi:hypothetical protein